MGGSLLIEQDIPHFKEIYYKGGEFDKSIQIFTDQDCETGYDFTYHEGAILYKRVNKYKGPLLSFKTSNDTLYMLSTGVIRRFRSAGLMPDLEGGLYSGDLRVRDLSSSDWIIIATFELEVRETANFKG